MASGNGWEAFWVVAGTVLVCGTWLYLWALAGARRKPQAKVILVALWLAILAMTMVMGPPAAIVMGAATVLMVLWLFAQSALWL